MNNLIKIKKIIILNIINKINYKEKLKENEHKIFRLLNTYYSSKRKINHIIGKLIEINKNKKKK